MKTTRETTIVLNLELNEEEIKWLREIMQNPIHCDQPNDEESYDASMRKRFWEALNDRTRPAHPDINGYDPSSPNGYD